MKHTIYLFMFLWPTLNFQLFGQDLHFTNNRAVSSNFNPGQCGDFSGYIKFQAATRTQYERTYEHLVLGGQINLKSPIRDNDWVSGGLNAGYDKSGSLDFKATGGGMGLAYHFAMDKKQKSVLSLGVSMDMINLGLNADRYKSEFSILGRTDPDRMAVSDFAANVKSWNVGLHYKTTINKKNQFRAGLAVVHANQPNFSVISTTIQSSIGRRYNVHTAFRTQTSKVLAIEPGVYLSFSERQKNINLQVLSEWRIAKGNKWQGVFGVSHRVGESIDIITGYTAERLYVGLSFDILTSQAGDIINNPGGIELGAFYIVNKNYVPKVKPIIFCPRL